MNYILNNTIPLATLIFILSSCGSKEPKAAVEEVKTPAATDSGSTSGKTVTLTAEQFKLATIETGSIESRNLSNLIKLNGVIDVEPASDASVSAPLGGYVRTAGLLPGESVKKGQVLATIENAEFITMQQEYLESIGRLQFLELELKRQQKLRDEDINAAKTLEQVSSENKIMKARISGLEQKMQLAGINSTTLQQTGKITRTANIYAPINGFVKSSNVNIGKYVNPTDVLFEIEDKSDLHLALNALEKDVNNIKVGQTVKFSLANENNFSRTAKVFLVGKSTTNDRNVPVHCHLSAQDRSQLLPGMYVKAWIETGTASQTAVPVDALVQLEGNDYIIVQRDQSNNQYSFELVQVNKGVELEGYAGITLPEGITASQTKIVVKNAYAILSALKNAEEE